MAYESNGMTPADIAAVSKGNGFGNDGNAWWIIILFLFAAMAGFNNNNNGPVPMTPPNVATTADVQRGFDQATTQNSLNSIIQQVNAGFANASTDRLDAQLNQQQNMFGMQTALQQTANDNRAVVADGMNGIVLGLQQLGAQQAQSASDLKYTVAQENCNDRQTINLGIRDLIAQQTANTNNIMQGMQSGFQGVQDKLCQLQIDRLREDKEQLQAQLNLANLTASQVAQTSQIMQNSATLAQNAITYIAPRPIPAYVVANPNSGTTSTTAS